MKLTLEERRRPPRVEYRLRDYDEMIDQRMAGWREARRDRSRWDELPELEQSIALWRARREDYLRRHQDEAGRLRPWQTSFPL